jgi:hypothetical protein
LPDEREGNLVKCKKYFLGYFDPTGQKKIARGLNPWKKEKEDNK